MHRNRNHGAIIRKDMGPMNYKAISKTYKAISKTFSKQEDENRISRATSQAFARGSGVVVGDIENMLPFLKTG